VALVTDVEVLDDYPHNTMHTPADSIAGFGATGNSLGGWCPAFAGQDRAAREPCRRYLSGRSSTI
jgi:hypothetical protein